MKRLLILLVVGITLSTGASGDEAACGVFSEALEMVGDSQTRSADFAGEKEVSLMCIQHGETQRDLETARTLYERCMPYLHSLGTPESRQVMQIYERAMADTEAGVQKLTALMETHCAGRELCTGDAQSLRDTIEYQIQEAAQARNEGNTLLACFTIENVLKPAAEELKEYANECMVQDALDAVREIQAATPNC